MGIQNYNRRQPLSSQVEFPVLVDPKHRIWLQYDKKSYYLSKNKRPKCSTHELKPAVAKSAYVLGMSGYATATDFKKVGIPYTALRTYIRRLRVEIESLGIEDDVVHSRKKCIGSPVDIEAAYYIGNIAGLLNQEENLLRVGNFSFNLVTGYLSTPKVGILLTGVEAAIIYTIFLREGQADIETVEAAVKKPRSNESKRSRLKRQQNFRQDLHRLREKVGAEVLPLRKRVHGRSDLKLENLV